MFKKKPKREKLAFQAEKVTAVRAQYVSPDPLSQKVVVTFDTILEGPSVEMEMSITDAGVLIQQLSNAYDAVIPRRPNAR